MEFQNSDFCQKMCFLSKKKNNKNKKIKNLIFVKNVLFPLRNTKLKTASHSDHPLK